MKTAQYCPVVREFSETVLGWSGIGVRGGQWTGLPPGTKDPQLVCRYEDGFEADYLRGQVSSRFGYYAFGPGQKAARTVAFVGGCRAEGNTPELALMAGAIKAARHRRDRTGGFGKRK